ncbi:hypothetical protein Aperf_G00000097654 [Anoplocephala perfoliata]
MSGGSDGQQQIHMGTPSQMQHQQMQPPMHAQMRPQSVIRQAMPMHMQQGQNIVRMQRPQIVKPGQMVVDQSTASFVPGQARMPTGGQMSQQVHVLPQGVMQSQPQPNCMPTDGGHNIQVGMVEQPRPIVTSYGPQGPTHMSSVPVFPMGGPGVQQPFYGPAVRIGGPAVQSQITTSPPVRLIPSTNASGGAIPAMHLVTQPNQMQSGPQQQHFISVEAQQQQQRMMASQTRTAGPGMKVIPPSQPAMVSQGGGGAQTIVRSSMSGSSLAQQQHQQHQQIISDNAAAGGQPVLPPSGPVSSSQDQRQPLKLDQQQCLHILDSTITKLHQTNPEADLKDYQQLRASIRANKIQPQNMPQIEQVIRRLSNEPTYLLRRQQQLSQQAQQHQNQAAIGGGGVVSEETRQKLLAQKRGVQGQQHGVPAAARPNLTSTSSSLNTLLSQPVDPPGGPTGGPYSSTMATRQTQQQSQILSQQQMALATAELLGETPMDDFNAAMDKIAEDMALLRKKIGPVRSAQIDNEICEMARSMLEKSGHLLPRDILPAPKSDTGPFINTGNLIIGEAMCAAEIGEMKATRKPKREELPIPVNAEDQLVWCGKQVTNADLNFCDLNPRLLAELEEMKKEVEEIEVVIVHPQPESSAKAAPELGDYPDIEEMIGHDTINDIAEWNDSLHLILNFHSKVLPCGVPPLYVCIPPAYLITKNVIWMYRTSDFETPQPLSNSIYNEREIECFRRASFILMRQFLDTYRILQRKAGEPISLPRVAEVWAKGVLKSVLTFREFSA